MKGVIRGMGHFARLAYAVAACALLAACGSTTPARQTQATVPDTTIPPANSYAIPPHITAAYVQRVLNALDQVDGDATRLIVANRSLVAPAVYRLEAIDGDPWFTEVTSTWTDDIASGLRNYRTNPGNQRDTVESVLSAAPRCIYVKVNSDFTSVTKTPPPSHVNYIELVPAIPDRDQGQWNPTPWMFGVEGWNSQGLVPTNPCPTST